MAESLPRGTLQEERTAQRGNGTSGQTAVQRANRPVDLSLQVPPPRVWALPCHVLANSGRASGPHTDEGEHFSTSARSKLK